MNTAVLRFGANNPRIEALSAEDIAQIKSSIQITSLRGVVLGLLSNALDAGSRSVSIHVYFSRGSCTVEDDGIGIPPSEFLKDGGLLKAYHTTKTLGSSTHGRSGLFLASLASVSLLVIESRHASSSVASSLTAHQSKLVARNPLAISETTSQSTSGTKVIVRNLFGNMPVRVKHRALATGDADLAEWGQLVHDVVHFMLAWPSAVTISLKDESTGKRVQLRPRQVKQSSKTESVLSILTQASIISSNSWASWVPISAKTSKIQIKGAISLDPAPTKQHQFISIGFRPILNVDPHNELYLQINRQFSDSRFGVLEEEELSEVERLRRSKDRRFKQDGPTKKQIMGLVKGVDRWPMFYLRIDMNDNDLLLGTPEQDIEETAELRSIMKVVEAMMLHWLMEHGFNSRKKVLVDCKQIVTRSSAVGSPNLSSHVSTPARDRLGISEIDDTILPDAAISGSMARSLRPGSSNGGLGGTGSKEAKHSSSSSAFETWSRIKSGQADLRRKIIEDKALKESADEGARELAADVCNNGEIQQPLAEEDNMDAVNSDGQDSWTKWRDPTTNATYDLNVRSGLLVPRSASSKLVVDLNNPQCTDRRPSPSSSIRLESRKSTKSTCLEPKPWLQSLATKWQNPVFRSAEQPLEQLPLADCGQDGGRSCNHNHSNANSATSLLEAKSTEHRLTSGDLHNAEIISQLENKFILIKLPQQSQVEDKFLVIVDQHAADERCKVEDLFKQLCEPNQEEIPLRSNLGLQSRIATIRLDKPIVFETTDAELDLFKKHATFFARWGVLYDIQQNTTTDKRKITLRTLPPSISERCVAEPRPIIDLLRSEVWQRGSRTRTTLPNTVPTPKPQKHPWLTEIGDCPQGILEMLNSRACRSAIMFNDVLSLGECTNLLSKLADCAFPFQCAHGRPSMVPLVGLGRLAMGGKQLHHEDVERSGNAVALGDKSIDTGDEYVLSFRKWRGKE